MDQGQVLEAQRLSRAMETTRARITGTVGELRENVTRAVDWREQVKTHPEPRWPRRAPWVCSWPIGLAPEVPGPHPGPPCGPVGPQTSILPQEAVSCAGRGLGQGLGSRTS